MYNQTCAHSFTRIILKKQKLKLYKEIKDCSHQFDLDWIDRRGITREARTEAVVFPEPPFPMKVTSFGALF
jgi:hypothetical protein